MKAKYIAPTLHIVHFYTEGFLAQSPENAPQSFDVVKMEGAEQLSSKKESSKGMWEYMSD